MIILLCAYTVESLCLQLIGTNKTVKIFESISTVKCVWFQELMKYQLQY